MQKKRVLSIAVLLSFTAFSSLSFAAGFRLPEQDSAAMGMASAFVGQADNPSAVWYNPAGMTQLEGIQMSGGLIAVYPVMTHENNTENPDTTDVSEREVHLPIHLYATSKLNERMAFGFGINNPFGLETDWDRSSSSTRYIGTFSKVLTTAFNPNIAYRLNNNLSMAFGIDYLHLRATLEKLIPTSLTTDANFRLSGDGDGWGVNAALKYKASDAINIGFSYRSRIKVNLEGTAEIFGTPYSGTGNTSITLPDLIQLGVSYHVSDKLIVNADIDYTMWSTYDRIVIESDVPEFNQTDEKQWDNVWCLRIGGQYKISDQWKLRAGYLYDKNPVGETHFEARTPDSDRQAITIGTGYQAGNITLDLAYLYLWFKDRTISNSIEDDPSPENFKAPNALNGTYKAQAHLAGITVSVKY